MNVVLAARPEGKWTPAMPQVRIWTVSWFDPGCGAAGQVKTFRNPSAPHRPRGGTAPAVVVTFPAAAEYHRVPVSRSKLLNTACCSRYGSRYTSALVIRSSLPDGR